MKTKTISAFVTLMLSGLAYSQQTVDELGDKIESAAKAKSAKELQALCFNTGEPKELTDAMSSLFSVFDQQNLQASEAKTHTTKDHTPEPKLPGSFQGKELEYLIPPTHWIVMSLFSKEGENPKMNFKLSFPAVKVGEIWRIPGIKYKAELAVKSEEDTTLTPSGLTIVVMDKANKVLDTVVVGDDKKSMLVTFTIPEGEEMIRVFAVGRRIDEAIPKDVYSLGRPRGEKSGGLGYVEVDIEEGILIGIKGSGIGKFEFSKTIQEEVVADLKGAEAASITTIEEYELEASDQEE